MICACLPAPSAILNSASLVGKKIVSCFVLIYISFTVNEAGQVFVDLKLFISSVELFTPLTIFKFVLVIFLLIC